MIRIYLKRSPELDRDVFNRVLAMLSRHNGVVSFRPVQEGFDIEKSLLSYSKHLIPTLRGNEKEKTNKPVGRRLWEDIFRDCSDIRQKYHLGEEDWLMLLTDKPNRKNWFSGADLTGRNNFFIHTGHWECYIPGDRVFPITYEVAAMVLQRLMFKDYEELMRHMHQKPRGCIMDLCLDKRDISLKMRTADICPDCQKLAKKKQISPHLMQQVFRILDDIRQEMLFRERFEQLDLPSRMLVSKNNGKVLLPDMGDLEVTLRPKEKTVYHLFLNHPEGIQLMDMSGYREELKTLYKKFGKVNNVATLHNRVEALVEYNSSDLSIQFSRINAAFAAVLGDTMAAHYQILGPNAGLKRIALDREYVKYM